MRKHTVQTVQQLLDFCQTEVSNIISTKHTALEQDDNNITEIKYRPEHRNKQTNNVQDLT